jgi:O-antigen/teichoic acid export membrane protein
MTLIEAPSAATLPDVAEAHPPVSHEAHAPGRRIVRNFIALSAARPLTWLSTIGLTILLPRYLGDVNLGKMNFAFSFADWCGLLASFGISTYLAKEVAQKRDTARSVVLNALLLRLALAVLVGGLAAVLATAIGYDPVTRKLVYLLTAHMLFTVFLGVLIGALQGVEQLRIVALIDAATKVLQLGLVALVLFQGQGPIGVAMAYVVTDLIAVVWMLDAVRRHVGFAGPVTLRAWRTILRGGMPFLVWETALLTYARVDVIILAIFAHDAVLGWYSAAYRIISIPLFVPAVLMTVMFPAFAASTKDEALFNKMARRAVSAVMLATVPMALGLAVLAGDVIDLFGYPDGFTNSITPTVLLVCSLPLVGVNMIIGSILSAKDKQRHWAIAGIGAAALNLSLNFVAIPYTQSRYGNGAIGAAAVTSLTEVFLLAAGQYLMPRGILDRATLVSVLKCVAVGGVMAAAVWLARDLAVWYTIPLGAVVYAGGALLAGAVSREDIRLVRGMVARRASA